MADKSVNLQRIGLICGSWPPVKCGIGDYIHRLSKELAGLGYELVVITDKSASAEFVDKNITVLPVIQSWRPTALPALLNRLTQNRVSLVNLQYPTQQYGRVSAVDWLPFFVYRYLRLPIITTIHEFSTYHWLGQWRVLAMAQASQAVIVPSLENMDLIRQTAPQLSGRLHHIPLGPNIEPHLPPNFDRAEWRSQHRLTAQTLSLVYFGFISPGKGVDVLLNALAQLPPEVDFHLWLLADHKPSNPAYAAYHAKIQEMVARFPQPDRLTWTGYLPAQELSPYLTAADLAVLPYKDGASLRRTTMLVSLAHSLPVLSTGKKAPCPGVEVISPDNPTELTEAIIKFQNNRYRLKELAEQTQQAADQLSWSTIAQKTAALFQQVTYDARLS